MRRIRDASWSVLALALACAGCSHPAPAPWLPDPRELDRFPYGASASVRGHGMWSKPVRGELIALDHDSVFVLTAQGLVGTPCREVVRVLLQADRKAQLNAPRLDLGWSRWKEGEPLPAKWERIRPFARFPGGLPDSLDRGSLRLPPGR